MDRDEENAALYYFPYRRTRDQIDQDVSRGRVYPLADVLFKFLFGRPERSELFLDLLNAIPPLPVSMNACVFCAHHAFAQKNICHGKYMC